MNLIDQMQLVRLMEFVEEEDLNLLQISVQDGKGIRYWNGEQWLRQGVA